MKRFIFWSTVLLALSGTMMGMAQENNVFPFTTDVIAVYKKDNMYYVVKECETLNILSKYFKENKKWAKKILKKVTRNKNGLVDILELINVIDQPAYITYYYGTEVLSAYDESCTDYDPTVKKHFLSIELPKKLFTYENVWKLYEYIMSRINISENLPYSIRLEDAEIREVLNAPLE